MEINTQVIKTVSNKVADKVGQLTLKPVSSFACGYILSKFWYPNLPGVFFGFEINRQLFHSGIVGVTSAIESTLREYILPNMIKNTLISNNLVDMTSPIVVGIANLMVDELLYFYNYGSVFMDKDVLWAFLYGFISEISGMYLYNNVIKSISDQMFV
jgi:hypothetical protein